MSIANFLKSLYHTELIALAGEKDVLLLANHGVLTVASTVSAAFDNLYYLERAAMVQVRRTIKLNINL